MRQAGQDQDQPGSLPPKRQRGPGLSRLACGHHVDPGGAAIQRGHDVQPRYDLAVAARAAGAVRQQFPKLIVRGRFPSPAPLCRAQAGDDVYRLGLDRFGVLVVCPFQAVSGLRNVRSRKNGIDTHS